MNYPQEKTKNISIVYFGSGPLAAESLAYLHETFAIEAVITKPRAAHHKGSVPVIEYCEANDIRCLTPDSKTALSETILSERFSSNLGIVIDYGIIIDRDVIESFPLGIVNSHFSLLPEWRGADPITFSLLSGQPTTGVSLMLINEKMDEGPLIAQAPIDITPSTNTISMTQELIELSNVLLKELIPPYVNNELLPVPQNCGISSAKAPTYSRKLTKQDGLLDWSKSAEELEREIRAFLQWPKSHTTVGKIDLIITSAHIVSMPSGTPGQIKIDNDSMRLLVACGKDWLSIDRLKPAGKNEMAVEDFIRGYRSRLNL